MVLHSAETEALPRGIPMISDPPPAIDGALTRFATIPGWQAWGTSQHVVFGREKWRDETDLSGEALLSWDKNYLYVAARVRDDKVVQPFFGANLWHGDHVMLMLDLPRQAKGERIGERVFRIGLSPGNLVADGVPSSPEAYCWTEPGRGIPGVKVAAKKTPTGYDIEAAIPWRFFGIDDPEQGLSLAYDIVVSDADNETAPNQEKLASLVTTEWNRLDPDRLVDAALGEADGSVDPAKLVGAEVTPIGTLLEIHPGEEAKVHVGERSKVKELMVRARNDFPKIAGGTPSMQIAINGVPLEYEQIRNRPETFMMGAIEASSFTKKGWFVLYAPDFTAPKRYSSYDTPEVAPYDFRFDVSSLWKPDDNVITVSNRTAKGGAPLMVELGTSKQLSRKVASAESEPAPVGEIPVYEPADVAGKDSFAWAIQPGGAIEVRQGGQSWNVESAYSTTAPGWAGFSKTSSDKGWNRLQTAKASVVADSAEFTVKRSVQAFDDHLVVSDELINTGEGDVPVMLRHEVALGMESAKVYIAGRKIESPRFYTNEGEAPTSLAIYSEGGIGLVMEDDLLRAQGQNYVSEGKIGLEDNYLVLAKGKSVTTRFSVYPIERPDPFLFINRIRRAWNVNFTLEGAGVVLSRNHPSIASLSDQELAQLLRNKGARTIFLPFPRINGIAAHGTAILEADLAPHREFVARLKRIVPECAILFYLHTFISNGGSDMERFADDRLLRPDGTQGDYSNSKYPIYLPRPGSEFAREQERLIALRFEQLGVDGIYWDEVEYSAFKWDYSPKHWDGVSGQIDARTHKLERKISNVMLATQAWRMSAATSLLNRSPLVGNGAPQTEGMTQLHFPRFAETGSISNLTKGQLYSPISLGDHLTERTVFDCYRNMLKALDYGSLYYWYTEVGVAQPTLTSWMYPTTPIELGAGFIISKERILTSRSGYFGWGDGSSFEAVVFDNKGRRTESIEIPLVVRGGKNFAEIRIPGGYSVALVRKLQAP